MKGNRALIPVSALVVFTTISLAEIQENDSYPGADQLIGFTLVFFFLSAMADFGLPIAGGLALLFTVGVVVNRGESALGYVTDSMRESRRERNRDRRGPRGGGPGTLEDDTTIS